MRNRSAAKSAAASHFQDDVSLVVRIRRHQEQLEILFELGRFSFEIRQLLLGKRSKLRIRDGVPVFGDRALDVLPPPEGQDGRLYVGALLVELLEPLVVREHFGRAQKIVQLAVASSNRLELLDGQHAEVRSVAGQPSVT
jgi:hypothetical protein